MESLDLVGLFVVVAAALLSALLGSVAGSGGSAVLLPVLVLYFGIREAVPILTIANLAANWSRVGLNRKQIVFPVVGWFALGTVPTALLGAYLFTVTAPEILTRMLGAILIAVVLWRHVRRKPRSIPSARWFLPIGAVFGFLEGIIGSAGPLMAPFFLAFGLIEGAYIGTDALAIVAIQTSKLAVFGGAALLGTPEVTMGLLLVPFMIAGTLIGKQLLDRVSERAFSSIVEVMLAAAGLNFLLGG